MTLTHQIKEAQQALADLLADETELSKLEQEQTAELHSLKAGGSKDFAHLATLEGKRAALASMLTEQRGHITQARTRLTELETARGREIHLERIEEIAGQIRQTRDSLHAGRLALIDTLRPELVRLMGLHREWDALRVAFVAEAREMGLVLYPDHYGFPREGSAAGIEAMWAELEARGGDVDALKLTPGTAPQIVGQVADPLPFEMAGPAPASIEVAVPPLVGNLYLQALQLQMHLQSRQARFERETQRAAVKGGRHG
ncbi:hypothetical protein [Deinococcus sp. QL22]|uniref:hypothetical protein n=1 Tax=Deinococcus sp. QL22 TaxID=2939437 RepID=UPI002017EFC6|nr:hypothetical protein [Deinococcus sp. QL22]UQN04976.1 hypothetical protein M1R55_08620 [Deinococcus sp. QL22]